MMLTDASAAALAFMEIIVLLGFLPLEDAIGQPMILALLVAIWVHWISAGNL